MQECNIKFKDLSELWYKENMNGICYTYTNSQRSMVNHLNNYFGDMYITEVKPIYVIDMINSLAIRNPHTGKPTSKETLKKLIKTLYRIYDMAIDNDWAIKNPAKGKIKCIPKNAPQKIVKAIKKNEQRLIIETAHRCQTAALIMMLMGLRRGELIALEWCDFDFDSQLLYVCKHAVKVDTNEFQVYPGTKNDKTRYVNIPSNLCNYLQREKNRAKSNWVFPKINGSLQTPSSFSSAWRGYINQLNYADYTCKNKLHTNKFDPKGYPKTIKINPHQLRHTYATLLYISGTDVLTASKLLGHSSVQITLDIYTHLDEEYKTLDISNFNEYLSSDLCEI